MSCASRRSPSTGRCRDVAYQRRAAWRLNAAISEVSAAETALETALDALRGGVRAEKVKVTDVVESAFTRLRKAHGELAKLQEIVDKD